MKQFNIIDTLLGRPSKMMGILPWLIPAGIGAGSLLSSIFGWGKPKQPEAPQMGAPQYQPDLSWMKDWISKGETGIRQQTSDWLSEAMRGHRKTLGAGARGWDPYTTSSGLEFGERAGGMASRNMSQALANLYGQAAQTEAGLKGIGMQQYGQDYRQWLGGMQQGQQDWISGLMGIVGGMPWSTMFPS